MSKEELIEQPLNHDDIAAKLSELTKRIDGFSDKHETVHSELKTTQNCNCLLMERVYQLEHNTVTNSQYHRRETLEINPVPLTIQDNVLEETLRHAFSLTGINMSPDQVHAFHRLNKKDRVIIKLKCRKHRQNVLYDRRNLQSKGLELTQLKFSGKLFVNESLSHENKQLTYKCWKLKSASKIFSVFLQQLCKH